MGARKTNIVTGRAVGREEQREYQYDSVTEKSPVKEIDLKARLLITVARVRKWDMAADNLEYYLNGVKLTKKIPRKWLRQFRAVKEAEGILRWMCQNDILNLLRDYSRGNKRDTTLYLTSSPRNLISYNNAGESNEELFYASGDSTLKGQGAFQIDIKGDIATVTGRLQYKWYDDYDFHKGKSVLIPLLGKIPDAAMKKLVTQGKAREYRMESSWSQTLDATFKISRLEYDNINWDWGLAY